MSRIFLRLVLLGVIGGAAAPARVAAQPASAPTVGKKQAAKQYTEAGLTAAKLGDYDTAISFYQKAYSLVPHPTLIFDIAEAQRLAGRIDEALTLYQRYLSDAPNGPLAQHASDRIAEIDASRAEEARKLEEARRADEERKATERRAEEDRRAAEHRAEKDRKAEEARNAEDARRVEAARKAAEVARTAREHSAAAAGPPVSTAGTTSDVTPPPGHNHQIAGITMGAGGVVGVVIGIGFGIHARTLSNDLSKKGAVYDPSRIDAGHSANTIAIVGMAGGAALVAAGAALYWWGYTQGRATEWVSLTPIMSDRLAGLVVAGTWR